MIEWVLDLFKGREIEAALSFIATTFAYLRFIQHAHIAKELREIRDLNERAIAALMRRRTIDSDDVIDEDFDRPDMAGPKINFPTFLLLVIYTVTFYGGFFWLIFFLLSKL